MATCLIFGYFRKLYKTQKFYGVQRPIPTSSLMTCLCKALNDRYSNATSAPNGLERIEKEA